MYIGMFTHMDVWMYMCNYVLRMIVCMARLNGQLGIDNSMHCLSCRPHNWPAAQYHGYDIKMKFKFKFIHEKGDPSVNMWTPLVHS